jgi:hypothetical protein
VVLSAAAIASSLFGSQAVRAGLGIFGWIAVLAFLGLSLALLLILWPRNDWQDTSLPSRVLAKGIEVDEPLPMAFIRRDLALQMERVYLTNTDSYVRLARSFRAAVMLLNLEVLAWVLAIATGA